MAFERTDFPLGPLDVEVFHQDALTTDNQDWFDGEGFYFWWCSPGCLPEGDGTPFGPYDTYDEALETAREMV